ncbi:hypothetical protein TNCT_66221 [Trichonephila clavata]|uniref:Uncharacterized protein n=1 Tax=Trichonephila clavata TaxID=2740835 RepID=A0A8X6LBC5_TRICU|nr:hypothetical protein TNCT_66221 [Trichonephila clavata]
MGCLTNFRNQLFPGMTDTSPVPLENSEEGKKTGKPENLVAVKWLWLQTRDWGKQFMDSISRDIEEPQ